MESVLGRLQAGNGAQDRGLAAAARAQQRQRVTLADLERHAVDGGVVAEPLASDR